MINRLCFKERQKLSRQDRKKIKEKAQLSHDLEENELKDKLRAKNSLQTRILEQIFLVYFNILKKAPNFKLIPSVLEGLSRFAHLLLFISNLHLGGDDYIV
jgi:nucleolar complex protein 3